MKNKYLKSSAFVVAPAIIGSTLPGNVSNALSVGEAWEYVLNAFWSLWVKMKFWETKEQDLATGDEFWKYSKDFSDAKEQSLQGEPGSTCMDENKLNLLKSAFNPSSANNSDKLNSNTNSNINLMFQVIDTKNHVIKYRIFDYNNYNYSDVVYCYSLFTSNNNENYMCLDDYSTGMNGDKILFNPNKPNKLRVFYAIGGSTLFDFSNRSQVIKNDFDQEGNPLRLENLGNNVPPIVKEIETVMLWIKEKDKDFYNQFEPASNNNMGGFQANNMQGAQNNNIINS